MAWLRPLSRPSCLMLRRRADFSSLSCRTLHDDRMSGVSRYFYFPNGRVLLYVTVCISLLSWPSEFELLAEVSTVPLSLFPPVRGVRYIVVIVVGLIGEFSWSSFRCGATAAGATSPAGLGDAARHPERGYVYTSIRHQHILFTHTTDLSHTFKHTPKTLTVSRRFLRGPRSKAQAVHVAKAHHEGAGTCSVGVGTLRCSYRNHDSQSCAWPLRLIRCLIGCRGQVTVGATAHPFNPAARSRTPRLVCATRAAHAHAQASAQMQSASPQLSSE